MGAEAAASFAGRGDGAHEKLARAQATMPPRLQQLQRLVKDSVTSPFDADEPVFVLGTVTGLIAGSALVTVEVAHATGPPGASRVHVHASKVWPHNEEDSTGVDTDNIIDIKFLHEPAVLHALGLRFSRNLTYTFSGPLLVSLNPFQVLRDAGGLSFYGPRQMARVRMRPSSAEMDMEEEVGEGTERTPAHVFCMADDAFRRLQRDGVSQSIIFLGSVGAGKTAAMVQCLSYLTHLAALDAVVFNTPLLQAADKVRSGAVLPPGADEVQESPRGRSATVSGGMRAISVANRQTDMSSDDYGLSMSRRKATVSSKGRLTNSLMSSSTGRKLLSGGVGTMSRKRRPSSRLSMAFYGTSPVAAKLVSIAEVRSSMSAAPTVGHAPLKRRGVSLLFTGETQESGSPTLRPSASPTKPGAPGTASKSTNITKNNLDAHLGFASWDSDEGLLAAKRAEAVAASTAPAAPSAGVGVAGSQPRPSSSDSSRAKGSEGDAAAASGYSAALHSSRVPDELPMLTQSHEHRLLAVPGALDPMGTASGPGPNASSRYGSIIRVFFRQGATVADPASIADYELDAEGRVVPAPNCSVGLVRGAVVDTLLLERARVTTHTSLGDVAGDTAAACRALAAALCRAPAAGSGQSPSEWSVDEAFPLTQGATRNFNVFYSMLGGVSSETRAALHLPMSPLQSGALTPLPVRILLLQCLWWTSLSQVHAAVASSGRGPADAAPLLHSALKAVTTSFIQGRVLSDAAPKLTPLPIGVTRLAHDGVTPLDTPDAEAAKRQRELLAAWAGPPSHAASAAWSAWLASLERLGMGQAQAVQRVLAAIVALSEVEFTEGAGDDGARVITGPSVPAGTPHTIPAPSLEEAAETAASSAAAATAVHVSNSVQAGGGVVSPATMALVLAARAGQRFDDAASLLGLSGRQLAAALTTQAVRVTMAAGPRGGAGRVRGSTTQPTVQVLKEPAPLSLAAAIGRRDTLMQHLYARVFGWVVRSANACLQPQGGPAMVAAAATGVPTLDLSPLPRTVPDMYRRNLQYVALVDMPGWECCNSAAGGGVLGNTFHQLCVNYSAELLEEAFTRFAIRAEENVYAAEGIRFKPVVYPGNASILEVLDRPSVGIMPLLEEAARFARASDESLARKVAATHKRSLAGVAPPPDVVTSARLEARVLRRPPPLLFTVRHTHADVTYNLRGALQDHRGELDADLSLALQCSDWEWMATLMHDEDAPGREAARVPPLESPAFPLTLIGDDNTLDTASGVPPPDVAPGGGPARRTRRPSLAGVQGAGSGGSATQMTVGARFRAGINNALNLVASPSVKPSFVRCLLPNPHHAAGRFDPGHVVQQLRVSGVVPALTHRHSGYVFNTTFTDFYERFIITIPSGSTLTRVAAALPAAEGAALTSLARELPPFLPPRADTKKLCEQLLQALWLAYPDSLGKYSLSQQVQAGSTKLFTRKEAIQELEALREMALQEMDAAALVLQHHLYGHAVRAQFAKGKALVVTLQSLHRMRVVRRSYRRHRAAAIMIQRRVKSWRAQKDYLALRNAVQSLKQKWIAVHMHARWLRVRRTLRRMHALALGFFIRTDMARRQNSVRVLQAAARSFLRRNRLFWAKVHGALLVQAAYRGHAWRSRHRPLVGYVRRRVVAVLLSLRLVRAQAAWRGCLARRTFQRLRRAAVTLQHWVRGALYERGYAVVRAAAPMIQRAVRRHLSRRGFRQRQEAHHIAAAAWRVKRVRERELKALAQYGLHCEAVDDAKRSVLAARRYAAHLSEATRDKFFTGTSAGRQQDGVGHDFYLARDSFLLDVDAVGDVSEVYPKGWTHSMASLDLWLRAHAGHVAGLAVGSSHTVVLSSTGQVYTFGWGDEGQLGQGYVLDDAVEDADVPGLTEAAEGKAPASPDSPRRRKGVWRGRYHETTVSRAAKMAPLLPPAPGKSLEATGLASPHFKDTLRSSAPLGSDTGAFRGQDPRAGWGAGVLASAPSGRGSAGQSLRPSVVAGGMGGVGMVTLTPRGGAVGSDSDEEWHPASGVGKGYTVSGSRDTSLRPARGIIPSRRAREALGFGPDAASLDSVGFAYGEEFSSGFSAGGSGAAVGGAAGTLASTGGTLEGAAGGGGLSALRRRTAGVTASGRSLSPPPALRSAPGSPGASLRPRHSANALYRGDSTAQPLPVRGGSSPDGAAGGVDVGYDALLQSGLHPQSPVRRALVDSMARPGLEATLHGMGHTDVAASERARRQAGQGQGLDQAYFEPTGTPSTSRTRRQRRNSWSYSPWLAELRGGEGAEGVPGAPQADAVLDMTGAPPPGAQGASRRGRQGVSKRLPGKTLAALNAPRRRIKYSSGLHDPRMVTALRFEPGAVRRPLFSLNDGVKIKAIAAGAEHTLCLSEAGRVFAWGCNAVGQLGLGGDSEAALARTRGPDAPVTSAGPPINTCAEPAEVAGLHGHGIVSIAAGRYHSLAVTKRGQVFTWGRGCDCGHGKGYAAGQGKAKPQGRTDDVKGSAPPAESLEARRAARAARTRGWATRPRGTRSSRQREALARKKASRSQTHAVKAGVGGFSAGCAPGAAEEEQKAAPGAQAEASSGFATEAALRGIPHFYTPTLVRGMASQVVTSAQCGVGVTACLTVHGRVYVWGPGWGRSAATAVKVAVQEAGYGSGEAEAAAREAAERAAAGEAVAPLQPTATPLCVWPLGAGGAADKKGYESVLPRGHGRGGRWDQFNARVQGDEPEEGSQPASPPAVAPGQSSNHKRWAGRAVELAVGGRHMLLRTSKDGVWAWGVNSEHQCGVPEAGAVVSAPRPVTSLCGKGVLRLGAGWRHSVAITGDHRVWTWGHVSPSLLPRHPRSAFAIGATVSTTGHAHVPKGAGRRRAPAQLPAPPAPATNRQRAAARRAKLAAVQSSKKDLLARSLLTSFMAGVQPVDDAARGAAGGRGQQAHLSREDELARHIYEHMIAGDAAQEHAEAAGAQGAASDAPADDEQAEVVDEVADEGGYAPLAVDHTHVVVAMPTRVPFVTKARHAIDVTCAAGPSLSVTVLGYEQLLLQNSSLDDDSDSDPEWGAAGGLDPEDVVDGAVADGDLLSAVAETESAEAAAAAASTRRGSFVDAQRAAMVRRAHDEAGDSPGKPWPLASPDLRGGDEEARGNAATVTSGGVHPHANATGGVLAFVGVDRFTRVSTHDVRKPGAVWMTGKGQGAAAPPDVSAATAAANATVAELSTALLPPGMTLAQAQEQVRTDRAARTALLAAQAEQVDVMRHFKLSPTQRALGILEAARVPPEEAAEGDTQTESRLGMPPRIDLSRVPPISDLAVATALAFIVDAKAYGVAAAEAAARIAGAGSLHLAPVPPLSILLSAWRRQASESGRKLDAATRSSPHALAPDTAAQLLELVCACPAGGCLQAQGLAVFGQVGREADTPFFYGDGSKPVTLGQRRMSLLPIRDLLTGRAVMAARVSRLALRLWTVRRLAKATASAELALVSAKGSPGSAGGRPAGSPPRWATAPLTPAQLVPELPPSLLSSPPPASASTRQSAVPDRRDSIIALAAGAMAAEAGRSSTIQAHTLLGGDVPVSRIVQRDWRMAALFTPHSLLPFTCHIRIRGRSREGAAFDLERETAVKALVLQREAALATHAFLLQRLLQERRVGVLGAGKLGPEGSEFRRRLLSRARAPPPQPAPRKKPAHVSVPMPAPVAPVPAPEAASGDRDTSTSSHISLRSSSSQLESHSSDEAPTQEQEQVAQGNVGEAQAPVGRSGIALPTRERRFVDSAMSADISSRVRRAISSTAGVSPQQSSPDSSSALVQSTADIVARAAARAAAAADELWNAPAKTGTSPEARLASSMAASAAHFEATKPPPAPAGAAASFSHTFGSTFAGGGGPAPPPSPTDSLERDLDNTAGPLSRGDLATPAQHQPFGDSLLSAAGTRRSADSLGEEEEPEPPRPIPVPTASRLQPARRNGRRHGAGRKHLASPAPTKIPQHKRTGGGYALPGTGRGASPAPPGSSPPRLTHRGPATGMGDGVDGPVMGDAPRRPVTSPGASKAASTQRADSPLWNPGGSYLNAYRTGAPTAALPGQGHGRTSSRGSPSRDREVGEWGSPPPPRTSPPRQRADEDLLRTLHQSSAATMRAVAHSDARHSTPARR